MNYNKTKLKEIENLKKIRDKCQKQRNTIEMDWKAIDRYNKQYAYAKEDFDPITIDLGNPLYD